MIEDLGDGIHRWRLRHPEWHPGEFGALDGLSDRDTGGAVAAGPDVLDDDVLQPHRPAFDGLGSTSGGGGDPGPAQLRGASGHHDRGREG